MAALPPSPIVGSVSPASGSRSGGTRVTIAGANFVAGAVVSFGTVAAMDAIFVTSASITVTTPPHSKGTVSVTVANPDGQRSTLANAFTYTPRK
jgi:hypothetical protein